MKNLSIKTTGWEMTDEIRNYLEEKIISIEKLLADPDADDVKCDIELEETRQSHANVWRAEMNLFVGGTLYRAEATADGMQAAIDEIKDDMQRQLRKSKRKNLSLIKRGGARLKSWMRFGREGGELE